MPPASAALCDAPYSAGARRSTRAPDTRGQTDSCVVRNAHPTETEAPKAAFFSAVATGVSHNYTVDRPFESCETVAKRIQESEGEVREIPGIKITSRYGRRYTHAQSSMHRCSFSSLNIRRAGPRANKVIDIVLKSRRNGSVSIEHVCDLQRLDFRFSDYIATKKRRKSA